MHAASSAVRTTAGVIGALAQSHTRSVEEGVRDRGKDCRDRFLAPSVRAAVRRLEHDGCHLRVILEAEYRVGHPVKARHARRVEDDLPDQCLIGAAGSMPRSPGRPFGPEGQLRTGCGMRAGWVPDRCQVATKSTAKTALLHLFSRRPPIS